MGNSPSSASAAPAAPAPAPAAPAAPAPAAPAAPAAPVQANAAPVPAASLASNSKKNNTKTVVQVPAENVTVSKGGKRRRLRGGVASVQFDLIPRYQPSDTVMERATSAPSNALKGGKRRRTHRRRTHRRHSHRRH